MSPTVTPPPVRATSLEEAVRVALPYLRIARAGLLDRLPSGDECVEGIGTAIEELERALSRDDVTTRVDPR